MNIPKKPGIYLMKNKDNEVIYIGKAKNLHKRVSSYFNKRVGGKTLSLIQNVTSIDTILTDNEVEALILESNLVREYKPKFNIELKDNNRYPYIKITNEKFPRMLKTRIKKDDGALYFGPYPGVKAINRNLKTITDIFPIRRCKYKIEQKGSGTPCLNYYLKKCICPIFEKVEEGSYRDLVHQVVLFLKGQNTYLLNHLKREMEKEAKDQRFEQAISLRERYLALKKILEEQKMTTDRGENEDIIGLANWDETYSFVVLVKRDGKIIGKRDYRIKNWFSKGEVLEQFLEQFYENNSDIPKRILLPFDIESRVVLKNYFKRKYNKNVDFTVPEKGLKKKLVVLACKNAQQKIDEEIYRYDPVKATETIRDAFKLSKQPKSIEAFDVATILGDHSVAAMVRFSDGLPEKKNYRRYRIRYVERQNDIEMIKEAVARRYQRLLNENSPLPDLILVDGGKPQVNGTLEVLKTLNLSHIPVLGLAKQYEDVYTPEAEDPITLEKGNDALRLLMAIRNEAHRFANTYHIKLRTREALNSKLKSIPGIGDALANSIISSLNTMGSDLSIDTLKSIRGIGSKRAQEVLRVLNESKF